MFKPCAGPVHGASVTVSSFPCESCSFLKELFSWCLIVPVVLKFFLPLHSEPQGELFHRDITFMAEYSKL